MANSQPNTKPVKAEEFKLSVMGDKIQENVQKKNTNFSRKGKLVIANPKLKTDFAVIK